MKKNTTNDFSKKDAAESVFHSNDILNIIADYIVTPKFSKQDWNTFSRLNRKTSTISKRRKTDKTKVFKVDLIDFEKRKVIQNAISELSIISTKKTEKQRKKDLQYSSKWKLFMFGINNIAKRRLLPYYRYTMHFDTNVSVGDVLENAILKDIFNVFSSRSANLYVCHDLRGFVDKFLIKNMKFPINKDIYIGNGRLYLMCKAVDDDCSILIDYTTNVSKTVIEQSKRGILRKVSKLFNCLTLVFCNVLEHQKQTIQKVLKSAKNDKIYTIDYVTKHEKNLFYDFLSDAQLSAHVRYRDQLSAHI